MRAIDFLYEHQRLDEVAMSPGKLSSLAKAIGATAGMEFEMIVPNVEDPGDYDYENDYDSDERASSFNNIEDFFMGGDGNNARSDVRHMISKMSEYYYDWLTERQSEDWSNEGLEFLKDYIEANDEFNAEEAEEMAKEEIRENNPDLPEDSDEFHEKVRLRIDEIFDEFVEDEWNNNGRIYDRAYEQFIDDYSGPDEGDWLNDNYKYMTDVYNEFGSENDVFWPYTMRSGGNESLDNVAESFSDAIGRPCNASSDYHGIRRDREYTVEPDGSLDPDSSDDTGLEFVSPPLPLSELIADLADVIDWAESYGCYTNESTGLHMNVSVPSYSSDKLDYVKLAILLGDEYVLKQFGREGNSYTKSAMSKVRANIGNQGERTQEFLQQMRVGLTKVASEAIHSNYTDKYTSINTKTGYIEFRSPGGDWLNEDMTKLVATLNRFVVALDAACSPEKYKNEYYKKLYKLLSAGIEESYGEMINDFAMYASGVGGAPQKVVADFRRLALAALQASRGKETGEWWWNVSINGQRIEVVGSSPKDAWTAAVTAHPTWSRLNPKDAKITRLRPFVDNRPANGTSAQATAGEPQALNNTPNFYIVDANTNTIVNRYFASSIEQAHDYLTRWVQRNDPNGTGTYRYGRLSPEIEQSFNSEPQQSQPMTFEIFRQDNNEMVERIQATSFDQATDRLDQLRDSNPSIPRGVLRVRRIS